MQHRRGSHEAGGGRIHPGIRSHGGRDGRGRVYEAEDHFFFFQAEDGIRDVAVTGVQTCALPISRYQLDPVQAAFNIGAMIRWLDFNDTWLAAEWGHPSDNLGAILAVADWLSRNKKQPLLVKDVLTAMIRAHEIQGVIALENSFNRVGLDHVVLVKVASAAVVAPMLGCTYEQVVNAVSQAWVDGQALRTTATRR